MNTLRAFALACTVVAGHALGFGCASAIKSFDELNDPKDDAKLAQCRDLARKVKADSGDPDAGYGAYRSCTKDGGF